MRKKLAVILFLFVCYSCTNTPNKHQTATSNNPQAEKNKTLNKANSDSEELKLHFSAPTQVDTSAYVIYSLYMGEMNGSSFKRMSGSEGTPHSWNLIFLNTETHKYHLLDSSRRMLIRSFDADQESTDVVVNGHKEKSKYLFYSIITDDANKDGKLDEGDPEYLFISDKTGNNFKQISPANFDVRGWKVINETNKVLISGVDSRNMKHEDAEITPFIYDLKSGAPSYKAFSDGFIKKTKRLFDKQWGKKE